MVDSASSSTLSGDAAHTASAYILYQRMLSDPQFERHCAKTDFPKLISSLRRLLTAAFNDGAWPKVRVGPEMVHTQYDAFSKALSRACRQSATTGQDVLLGAIDLLSGPLADDADLAVFFDYVRNSVEREAHADQIAHRASADSDVGRKDTPWHNLTKPRENRDSRSTPQIQKTSSWEVNESHDDSPRLSSDESCPKGATAKQRKMMYTQKSATESFENSEETAQESEKEEADARSTFRSLHSASTEFADDKLTARMKNLSRPSLFRSGTNDSEKRLIKEELESVRLQRDELQRQLEELKRYTSNLTRAGEVTMTRTSDGGSGEDHDRNADGNDDLEGGIATSTLEEFVIKQEQRTAVETTWLAFVTLFSSREAAGKAIFSALFESAPHLQSMFTSPRAVHAMKFMSSVNRIVNALSDPAQLKVLVSTVAFGHIGWDATEARFAAFKKSFLDVMKLELGDTLTDEAFLGWKLLLNYICRVFVFVKLNYASRVQTLLTSWQAVNKQSVEEEESKAGTEASAEEDAKEEHGENGLWKTFKLDTTSKKDEKEASKKEVKEKEQEAVVADIAEVDDTDLQNVRIPTTYLEMFRFNAAVMGFSNRQWMQECLCCFDNIVRNVVNTSRMQQECDILALRISRVTKHSINLAEYKACMLSSLRSLLPGSWDSDHEIAWSWLWENVTTLLQRILGKPGNWETALHRHLDNLSEDQTRSIRVQIYDQAFENFPVLQEHFKQSDTRLHWIAARIVDMTLEMYRAPATVVDQISAIGLRHVGYGVAIELIPALVSVYMDVMARFTDNDAVRQGFNWSLDLMARILGSTIQEGSTIVMKAINENSARELRKALSGAPRKDRMAWMLVVQVGSQDISPLGWAIQSGSLEAAGAMIKDLLTIRADRARYYYGADELFSRHPDILKRLCSDASTLLPLLLDGLMWRARITEKGSRRVNYYIKHLVVDSQGEFAKNLEWIVRFHDPKIVCHPVVRLLANTVWQGCANLTFLYQKCWFFFTLMLFVTSQSVLEHLNEGENGPVERKMVMGCRAFIYLASMTQLIYFHSGMMYIAFLNGDVVRFGGIQVPSYLFSSGSDVASFVLMLSLFMMMWLEPILQCWNHVKQDEKSMFSTSCREAEGMSMTYSIFSGVSMLLYYVLLIDLAVFSTRVSAYVLVCIRMLYELGLFLLACCVITLAFSSAISVIKHEHGDFDGISAGSTAFVKMLLGMYSQGDYIAVEREAMMFVVCAMFLVVTLVFLMNLLIAQLNCAYSETYEDMLGYAILKRMKIIVDTMPAVSKRRWNTFVTGVKFDVRLEFNEGDLGLAGGVQIREPASENPTTIDAIHRYGGSTSPELQWPQTAGDAGEEADRFDLLEDVIGRFDERVRKIEQALAIFEGPKKEISKDRIDSRETVAVPKEVRKSSKDRSANNSSGSHE